ncbi:PREDICTED: neuroblastoma breakpoint family member 6-like protein, partial [Galeopterus variegatus]|uniref:Neuroblastoma breakpoint family member 6-like protein n=1 Tax=Galeopterus variegatus TaxID=482537 RepID=A0ABM0Q2F7_GALVR
MAVPVTTISGPRAEMSILETNQYLCSQLQKSKQNFRDLTEKYLISQATAYSLANHLQNYMCEECKELIKSVLEEKLQFEEEKLAEKTRPAARLGKYEPLIQAQAQELTPLRQKIQEGRGVCYLFTQHVKNTVTCFQGLLRSPGIDYHQGQRFCEQLAQGSQLAESLVRKLTMKNHNDKKNKDRQEPLASRLSRGLQEEEVNEVLENSLDEQYLTSSSLCGSHQPPSSTAFLPHAQQTTSALDVA